MFVGKYQKKRKATKTSEKTRIRFVCVCEGGGGRVFLWDISERREASACHMMLGVKQGIATGTIFYAFGKARLGIEPATCRSRRGCSYNTLHYQVVKFLKLSV